MYEITIGLFGMIGRALRKDQILKELRSTTDYDIRNLLMGMDSAEVASFCYTPEMEKCDAKIASVFGGKNAVAAANNFEPYSLAIVGHYLAESPYHFLYAGHLSTDSIHLYGSVDGTRFGVDGNTIVDLYVPDGFGGSDRNPKEFGQEPKRI